MQASGSDAELLRKFVESRSQEAFAQLVRRYVDLVYTSARRQVREANLAEDVTQHVFVVLATKAKSLRSETVLGAWLLGVVRNESRNLLKGLARRRRHEREAGEMKDQPIGGTGEARWELMEPLLDEALAQLNDGDRRAIVLRYFQNKSHRDGAAALGISEGSMRQRVHRGVERLRQFMAGKGVSVSEGGLTAGLLANAVGGAPAGLAEGVIGAQAGGAAGGIVVQKGAVLLMSKGNVVAAGAAAVLILGAAVALWVMEGGKGGAPAQAAASKSATTTAPAKPSEPPLQLDPDLIVPATKGPAWRAGGHPMFVPIAGLSYDDKRGTRDGNDHVAYIESWTWVKYSDVELGEGEQTCVMAISCDQAYAGEVISIRLDSPEGLVIGKLEVKATPGTFEQQATMIEGKKGRHDIYLTFTGGGFNIRSLKFTGGVRDATQKITGSSHAAASQGVMESGTQVVGIGSGKWVRYDTIDFGEGVTSFFADVVLQGPGVMQVRVDKLEGPVIAERTFAAPEIGIFMTDLVGMPVKGGGVNGKPVKGIHDVYLTFTGNKRVVDLNWFRFGRGGLVPAPATQPQQARPAPVPMPAAPPRRGGPATQGGGGQVIPARPRESTLTGETPVLR